MANISWKNSVSADWTFGPDWSTNAVPTAADAVSIALIGNYTVTISSADVANTLLFNAPGGTLFETAAGSLTTTGAFTINGGTVILNGANTIGGGVTLNGGLLAVGNANALGTGQATLNGGALLGTASEAIANRLAMQGFVTIAAAHGTTLNLNSSTGWSWNQTGGGQLAFGAPGQDGTIIWHTPSGSSITNVGAASLVVQGGTLQAGDASFGFFLGNASQATVNSGATIDISGFATNIRVLLGSGTVTDSGGAAALTLTNASNFSGALSGALSLAVNASTTLGGSSAYAGATTISAAATLTNTGAFTLSSDVGIASGGAGAAFVNTGSFAKIGGAGTSTVATAFTNNGFVVVGSGTVSFTGGLTNVGLIQGVLSGTTVTANAAGQTTFFGGTGDNWIPLSAAPTYVDGGAGLNTVEIAASMTLASGSLVNIGAVQVDNGVTVNLSNLALGEKVASRSVAGGVSAIVGTQGNDILLGGAGNDYIQAGNGAVVLLVAGSGAQTLVGGSGQDTFVGGSGQNSIICGSGNDGVICGSGQTSVSAGTGSLFVQAGSGLDFLGFPTTSVLPGHFDQVANFQAASGGNGTYILMPTALQSATSFQAFSGGTLIGTSVGGSFFDIFVSGVAPSVVQAQTFFNQ